VLPVATLTAALLPALSRLAALTRLATLARIVRALLTIACALLGILTVLPAAALLLLTRVLLTALPLTVARVLIPILILIVHSCSSRERPLAVFAMQA
jgi:hypothetical protein